MKSQYSVAIFNTIILALVAMRKQGKSVVPGQRVFVCARLA